MNQRDVLTVEEKRNSRTTRDSYKKEKDYCTNLLVQ